MNDETRGADWREASSALASKERAERELSECLSLIEETAGLIAKKLRGMTTATPERRRLREDFERATVAFINATGDPNAAVKYAMPSHVLALILNQSPAAKADLPAEGGQQEGGQADG